MMSLQSFTQICRPWLPRTGWTSAPTCLIWHVRAVRMSCGPSGVGLLRLHTYRHPPHRLQTLTSWVPRFRCAGLSVPRLGVIDAGEPEVVTNSPSLAPGPRVQPSWRSLSWGQRWPLPPTIVAEKFLQRTGCGMLARAWSCRICSLLHLRVCSIRPRSTTSTAQTIPLWTMCFGLGEPGSRDNGPGAIHSYSQSPRPTRHGPMKCTKPIGLCCFGYDGRQTPRAGLCLRSVWTAGAQGISCTRSCSQQCAVIACRHGWPWRHGPCPTVALGVRATERRLESSVGIRGGPPILRYPQMHMCNGRGVTPQAPFSCERQGVTLFASLKCSGRRSEWSGWASSARTLGKFCSLCSSSLFRCSGASHGLRVHLSFGLQALGLGLVLLTMPGSLGVYAAESLAADSAPEAAYTALDEYATQYASRWRTQHGYANDTDFAFAFASYEEARATGGTLIAEEWATIRSEASGSLFGAVASALDAPVGSSNLAAQVARRPTTFLKRVAAKGRLFRSCAHRDPPQAQSQVSLAEEFADELAEALYQLGAMKPAGEITAQLEQEWRAALRRRATGKILVTERPTLKGALLTFGELQVHMFERGRRFPPGAVDVDAFLFGGTKAQSRALAGLKWLAKTGTLGLELGGYDFRQNPQKEPKQAAVLVPTMVPILEQAVQDMYQANNPLWRALVGLWCCMTGCLRFEHLRRASPMRLSRSTFHFHCSRGKQRGNRAGFDFAVPAVFCSGWPWARLWLKSWQALPQGAQTYSGLPFDAAGAPFTTAQAIKVAQDIFTPHVGADVTSLTSYSFRRVGPTYANLAGWAASDQLALGDWLDTTKQKAQGITMPLRYSGARYTTSVRRKHWLAGSIGVLTSFATWDEIPGAELAKAESTGAAVMEVAIQRDLHTEWQSPIRLRETKPRFNVPRTLPLPDRVEYMMPRQINGKRVSASLRDGARLCVEYQRGRCSGPSPCPAGQHRCAILVQSGRVCGGSHPAKECREKRAVLAPLSPEREGTRPKVAAVVLRPRAGAPKASKEEAAALPPHPKKGPQRRALASDASDLPPLKRQRVESPAVPVRPPPEAPRRIPAEPVGPPPSRLLRPRTPPKTPPPSSPSSTRPREKRPGQSGADTWPRREEWGEQSGGALRSSGYGGWQFGAAAYEDLGRSEWWYPVAGRAAYGGHSVFLSAL